MEGGREARAVCAMIVEGCSSKKITEGLEEFLGWRLLQLEEGVLLQDIRKVVIMSHQYLLSRSVAEDFGGIDIDRYNKKFEELLEQHRKNYEGKST